MFSCVGWVEARNPTSIKASTKIKTAVEKFSFLSNRRFPFSGRRAGIDIESAAAALPGPANASGLPANPSAPAGPGVGLASDDIIRLIGWRRR
jgi:hypothetical protein